MIKKILKWAAIAIFVVFVGIQFIRPDYGSVAAFNPENTLESTVTVPADVNAVLARSCNDCHTSQTTYPWYSNIAPLSWGIASHIKDGRRHLNFSEWNSYDTAKKRKKLSEVCGEMEEGQMPLDQYLWLHPSAKVTPAEIKAVCDWTEVEREKLAKVTPPQ